MFPDSSQRNDFYMRSVDNISALDGCIRIPKELFFKLKKCSRDIGQQGEHFLCFHFLSFVCHLHLGCFNSPKRYKMEESWKYAKRHPENGIFHPMISWNYIQSWEQGCFTFFNWPQVVWVKSPTTYHVYFCYYMYQIFYLQDHFKISRLLLASYRKQLRPRYTWLYGQNDPFQKNLMSQVMGWVWARNFC